MRVGLGVAASAALAHVTALFAGFVWLDHAHVEEKLALPSRFADTFTTGFAGTGYYRPLVSLSLRLDAFVGGPFVFHATNIMWHALASVALFLAAQALGLSKKAAGIAGLLFAVHPVTGLVANAIAFRSEAMIAAALFALLWAHANKRVVLAALCVALGALAKETAIVLAPLFVVAFELSRRERERPRALFAAEGGALAAAVALRLAFAPAWRGSHPALSAGDAIGTRLAALAKSVAAIALPIDRTICDAFPITHVHQPAAIAGAIALGALAWGAWKKRGAALLLAVSVLPSLQLVPVPRWWSPHYVYVPLGFVVVLAADLAERRSKIAAWIVAAALGVVSLWDGRRYANDTALFGPEVASQPACREAQLFLGDVARDEQKWEAAAKRYEAALAPWPGVLAYVDRGAALQNLGVVRSKQRRFEDARVAFHAALEGTTDPRRRRELTHDLAAASLEAGDATEAARLLEEETARADALPESIVVRAIALERLGRHDEARALRERGGLR